MLLMFFSGLFAQAQKLDFKKRDNQFYFYTEWEVCEKWKTFKGRKNHGQKYCTLKTTVRSYASGEIDTVGWVPGPGRIFFGDDYKEFERLSARDKYIYDSLIEDGITKSHWSYFSYEPTYMLEKKKVEQFFRIQDNKIIVADYEFSKNKGVVLLSEKPLK